MSHLRPKVGVAAIVKHPNGKLLVGKRTGSHGAGTWQFPGGHLEYKEEFSQCAERETLEETNLTVKASKILAVTNDVFETKGKHYITIFVQCDLEDADQEPERLEPEKCEGWFWKTWDELRHINEVSVSSGSASESLFLPIVNFLKQTKSEDLW